MASPSDRRYSESHEWFKVDGDVVTIGITQYAADELTDITYVELKPQPAEAQFGGGGADYMMISGGVQQLNTRDVIYIVEVNSAATEDPSLLNSDPFDKGWLVRIRTDDTSPLDDLMDQTTYDEKNPVG